MILNIDVVSDLICPWCYIGKSRLEKAIAALNEQNGRAEARVTWHPFELNPDLPKEGLDRKTYRSAKFGSWEKSQALDAQVRAAGALEGISFRHDLMERTPNTFDGHRLVWLAGREGMQSAIVDALFRGYFSEGADIGERPTLIRIARACGLDAERVERFLESEEGAAEVREAEKVALRAGVSGVPNFVINQQLSVSGAQPVATLLGAFDQALRSAGV